MRGQTSIKNRLGIPGGVEGGTSIQSRLGTRGGGSAGRGRGGNLRKVGAGGVTTALAKTPITDARQKINLNKAISGRIGDARQSIELKRSKNRFQAARQQLPAGAALAVSTMRSISRGGVRRGGGPGRGGGMSSRIVGHGYAPTPVKTLKITTESFSPGSSSSGLFRSAVSGMGESQWPSYASPPLDSTRLQPMSSSVMLTRTVRNPQAKYPPAPPGFISSYSRLTEGSSGMYSFPRSSVTKVTRVINRPGIRARPATANPGYYQESDEEMEDDMDIDDTPPPAPVVLRSSIKSRLDTPSKFKVKVSNLQPSVTTEDIMVSERSKSCNFCLILVVSPSVILSRVKSHHCFMTFIMFGRNCLRMLVTWYLHASLTPDWPKLTTGQKLTVSKRSMPIIIVCWMEVQ